MPISFYCLAHRRPKYIWWNLLSFNLDLPDIDAYTPSVNIKVFSINITRTVECHTQYIERLIVTKSSFHNYDLSIYISSSNAIHRLFMFNSYRIPFMIITILKNSIAIEVILNIESFNVLRKGNNSTLHYSIHNTIGPL